MKRIIRTMHLNKMLSLLIDSDVMVHMPGGKLWTQIDEEWNVKMIGSVKRICKIELFEDFFH